MSLLNRLFGREVRYELASANVEPGWLSTGTWRSWGAPLNAIAGEHHKQAALFALCGPPRTNGYLLPVEVDFAREPTNPYDGNAIAASINGSPVGYLRREIAAVMASGLDQAGCASFRLCGVVRGGSHSASEFGVHVWVDRRLGPGPEILLGGEPPQHWEVPWPPYEGEGEAEQAISG